MQLLVAWKSMAVSRPFGAEGRTWLTEGPTSTIVIEDGHSLIGKTIKHEEADKDGFLLSLLVQDLICKNPHKEGKYIHIGAEAAAHQP